MPTSYPPAPRVPGDDPFGPLEDPDAPDTRQWVEAQNAVTERFLASHPDREGRRGRIAQLWDYPKRSVPVRRGPHWFQFRNSGLQAQPVLWVAGAPADEGRPLIDPSEFSSDGTVSVSALGIADDGRFVAYALSTGGSDWMTWRVREVASGSDLADTVEWSKFCRAAWLPDGSGFFYTAMDAPVDGDELTAPNQVHRVMIHRLGTTQGEDEVEFDTTGHEDWVAEATVLPGGRWLIVTAARGTGRETKLYARDLARPGSGLVEMTADLEASDHVVGSDGDDLILMTDRGAERRRVVRAGLGQRPQDWRELIPEAEGTLTEVQVMSGHIVCHYLIDASSGLTVHSLDGRFRHEISVPQASSLVAGPLGQTIEADGEELYFCATSWLQSGAVWKADLATGGTELVTPSGAPFDAERYIVDRVRAVSADGTEVPMWVVRPRDLLPDGRGRALLYGYGGFGIPITPAFSVTFAAWLDAGGVVAVANLRGGGEYGRSWHEAGRLERKQNVFDDFRACARWLRDSPWSGPGRVAISGGSNGGLLVGACLLQEPEIFGAAVADVGVFDMLRFHLFTIGWAWKSDYGDPEDPRDRAVLAAYSPLHNVKAGSCYPPTLLLTGDHDDRVVPAHSLKFAAALQEAQSCGNPILLRVSVDTGHGAGKPTEKLIDETADRLAFLDLVLAG